MSLHEQQVLNLKRRCAIQAALISGYLRDRLAKRRLLTKEISWMAALDDGEFFRVSISSEEFELLNEMPDRLWMEALFNTTIMPSIENI